MTKATGRVPFAFGIRFAAVSTGSRGRTFGWGMSSCCPSRGQSTEPLLCLWTNGDFFLVDGNVTVYNKNRAECLGRYRYHPFRWTYIHFNVIGGVLSSAREFHSSYTYTGALGDSSSCTWWHSIVYDLYLFVLDLCISW